MAGLRLCQPGTGLIDKIIKGCLAHMQSLLRLLLYMLVHTMIEPHINPGLIR